MVLKPWSSLMCQSKGAFLSTFYFYLASKFKKGSKFQNAWVDNWSGFCNPLKIILELAYKMGRRSKPQKFSKMD